MRDGLTHTGVEMENFSQVEVLPANEVEGFQGPLKNRQYEAFCTLVSAGMSMKKAYEESFGLTGRPSDINELLSLPEVSARLASIARQYNTAVGVTMVGHLEMLAQIRDLAMDIQEVGVAFQAERARGEVAGIYTSPGSAKAKLTVDFKQPKRPVALPAPVKVDSVGYVDVPTAEVQVAFA